MNKCCKCSKNIDLKNVFIFKCDCNKIWCSWQCASNDGYAVLVEDRGEVRKCNSCKMFNVNTAWSFTGHRPNKLYGYDKDKDGNILIREKLKEAILYVIHNHNAKTFISGMALGIDQWAAEIVLELKPYYPHIKLVAAIPCADHSKAWPKQSQVEWNKIVDKADYVYLVSNKPYTSYCMQKRNEWMVNKSIGQIAVWDGTLGGTANCIRYADNVGKTKRITIHPKTLNVKVNV